MTYLTNLISQFNSSKYYSMEIAPVEDNLKSCGFKPVNNKESSYNKTI